MSTQAIPIVKRKALAVTRKGVLDTPIRALIYGAEKVGKSTFAAGAPKPYFIGAESGTERLNVDRVQPNDWPETLSFISDLALEKHDYKTIVIDPTNWFEPLCLEWLTSSTGTTVESYGGGFNKIYDAEKMQFRELVFGLEKCWKRGMHVILTAHAQVKQFNNPEGPAFDRYELAMHHKPAGVLKQWVDAVLFARLETFTKKEKGDMRAKGYSSGARIMHTQPSAAYDAGARWKLPEELPLGWDDLIGAIAGEGDRAGELAKTIETLVTTLGDSDVTKFATSFVAKHTGDADRLAELANRLQVKLEEKGNEVSK